MENRILENDLRLPALYLINLYNGKISTTELSQKLREILKPSGDDLVILKNRNDDHFSQIVRNLTGSERPFVKNGFIQRDIKSGSPLFITKKGKQYLKNHNLELKYLLTNDFEYKDIKESLKIIENNNIKLQTFDENIIITEGLKKYTSVAVYERSKKLRDVALEKFSINGRISCDCCKFNFEDFYGSELGKGFIEMHHTKPIFKYKVEDIQTTIDKAINNLMPVCSNCHRMIHRNKNQQIEIQVLIENIKNNGIYIGFNQ